MHLYYCKRCGYTWVVFFDDDSKACFCCNAIGVPVPDKYISDRQGDLKISFSSEEAKRQLIEDLVKTSPEFDQEWFDRRDEVVEKKIAKNEAKRELTKAVSNGVNIKDALRGNYSVTKCPSCGSTNVSKIGFINRAVSTGLFGLASSKIGKTHKCNNCGTTW